MLDPLSLVTTFEFDVIIAAVSLVAGVVFSQKIKDWYKGIPSELRSALSSVESNALATVKSAQAKALADIKSIIPGAAVVTKVALAPAPVAAAPVAAPAPAPAPAPAATPAPAPVSAG